MLLYAPAAPAESTRVRTITPRPGGRRHASRCPARVDAPTHVYALAKGAARLTRVLPDGCQGSIGLRPAGDILGYAPRRGALLRRRDADRRCLLHRAAPAGCAVPPLSGSGAPLPGTLHPQIGGAGPSAGTRPADTSQGTGMPEASRAGLRSARHPRRYRRIARPDTGNRQPPRARIGDVLHPGRRRDGFREAEGRDGEQQRHLLQPLPRITRDRPIAASRAKVRSAGWNGSSPGAGRPPPRPSRPGHARGRGMSRRGG